MTFSNVKKDAGEHEDTKKSVFFEFLTFAKINTGSPQTDIFGERRGDELLGEGGGWGEGGVSNRMVSMTKRRDLWAHGRCDSKFAFSPS